MTLTPDKKTLVAVAPDGTIKIGDVAARTAKTVANRTAGAVLGVAMAPAGDRFVVFSEDGEVKVWTLAGTEVRGWQLPVRAAAAAFAPDGKTVVTANGRRDRVRARPAVAEPSPGRRRLISCRPPAPGDFPCVAPACPPPPCSGPA